MSSTKSVTGHCFGAAGAIEAMMCVLAIHEGVLPPTINYENPDPECDLDYVPNEAREAKVDVALSNAMGLGGHNGCVLARPRRATAPDGERLARVADGHVRCGESAVSPPRGGTMLTRM